MAPRPHAAPSSSGGADGGLGFIMLLVLPTAYIFLAVFALLQFQVVYALLAQAAVKVKTVAALKFAAPYAAGLVAHFEKIFGQPHRFTPQLTHVLLVALTLAVIIHLERSRR